jgi:TonB family protein
MLASLSPWRKRHESPDSMPPCFSSAGRQHHPSTRRLFPAEDRQATTSQGDANKQPEPAKLTPRPNPDASGLYHPGDGIVTPKLIYQVEPEFSEKARKHKISGNVGVRLVVDIEGHVQDARISRSAAEDFSKNKDREMARTLDAEALKAVQQYRFEPGTFHSKPVPVELNVEINFQIF